VNRGGSWGNNATNCRVAYRNNNEPANRNTNLGFRLVSVSLQLTGEPDGIH
jgi:formylglycine-generating enzyme required for sulfatase activity